MMKGSAKKKNGWMQEERRKKGCRILFLSSLKPSLNLNLENSVSAGSPVDEEVVELGRAFKSDFCLLRHPGNIAELQCADRVGHDTGSKSVHVQLADVEEHGRPRVEEQIVG